MIPSPRASGTRGGAMTEIGHGDAFGRPQWPARRGRLRLKLARAALRLRLLAQTPPRPFEPTTLFLGAVAVSTLLFLAFPVIDLAASQYFFSAGQGFPASQNPVLKAFRESSDHVFGLLVLGLLARLGWGLARQGLDVFMAARRTSYLLVALLIGPGLVVNGLLKSHWGRPRPVAVDQFGGDAPYQMVWQISDWCRDNCSFVSGEASSAAWFVAALVLVPRRYRFAVGIPVVIYAVLLSANRLAFGGHFLSDIVLSWSFSGLIFAVCYRLMVSAPGVAHRALGRGAVFA